MTRIKQLLLLGGFFEIIFDILDLFKSPIAGAVSLLAFIVFVIMAIIFLFKRKVEYMHRFAQKHRNISAFLYSWGWAPYLMAPYTVITRVIIYKTIMGANTGIPYTPSNPELLQTYVLWHNLVIFWGLILGLLLATVYVLHNLYLSHRKAPKAKANTAANNPGKKGEIKSIRPAQAKRNAKNVPVKKEIARARPAQAKRDAKNEPVKKEIAHAKPASAKRDAKNEPVKKEIARARPAKAKRDAKNEPVKKEIKRSIPAHAKPDAKNKPVKKGQIRQTKTLPAKRTLKAEPVKQEIHRAHALKVKK